MTIDDQIKDEKRKYDINREAAKITVLSSGKINKYGYLTGEKILPSNQKQIIKQAKFTYSPLGKAFEKQTKTIKDQEEEQTKTIKEKEEDQVKAAKDNNTKAYSYENELLLLKEKNIYGHLQ